MKTKKCNYVHEYNGRWVVAKLLDNRRCPEYLAIVKKPTPECSCLLGTLCHIYSRAFSYARRTDALKKARELYGQDATG